MENTKKSPWWTVLKIFISLIVIVTILFVGFFAFIKFKYNINIFTAISQLKAFGKQADATKIVDYEILDEDLDTALVNFDNIGLSTAYTKDKDGNVSFDPTKVTEDIQMSADLVLSDKQLGAVANNYLNTIIDQALKEEELSSIGAINIVQLKIFDINEDASGYSSAKVNIVIKVDLTQFKKNFTVFPLNLINKYIPNILYINSTNTITMTADFLYTINYESLTLNNLNSKQSSSILQLLNKFISIGSSQEVGETIGEYFCDTVIGSTQSQEGLGYALKPAGAKKCSFRQIENIGYFVISITTGIS